LTSSLPGPPIVVVVITPAIPLPSLGRPRRATITPLGIVVLGSAVVVVVVVAAAGNIGLVGFFLLHGCVEKGP
jgi:hypothetical protein